LTYGSEIAVVETAKQFSKKYNTFVVCNTNETIKHNDITYISFNDFHKYNHDIDLLIISRFLHYFLEYKVNAKKVYFWLHDLDFHYSWNNHMLSDRGRRIQKNFDKIIDKYICLTNWHKQQIINNYNVDEKKIFILPNGIDQKKLISFQDVDRIKERIIWCSDPTRGLDILLKNFNKIINILPNCELHIFFHIVPDWIQKIIKDEWKHKIFIHNKVSQDILWKEMRKSEYFIYTNRSHETFCMSAIEAYANGCKVFCNNFSGIGENMNKLNQYTISGNIDTDEWFDNLIKNIELKKNEKNTIKNIQQFDWNNIFKNYWLKFLL